MTEQKKCKNCTKPIVSNGKNNNAKYCSKECYLVGSHESRKQSWLKCNRKKWNQPREGARQCHICGGWYIKIATHTVQRHGLTHAELKEELCLDKKKGLIPEWHADHLREKVEENYSLVVVKNLIRKGVDTRFEKGHTLKYKRSPQTLERLKTQFKKKKYE